MNELRTEEEQIAAFKQWWKDNGNALLLAVVVIGGGYFGYTAWENNKITTAQEASVIYVQLQEALNNAEGLSGMLSEQQLERIRTIGYLADQLQEDYSSSQYAVLGAIAAARSAADRDDYAQAKTRLLWAQENAQDSATEMLLRGRLAQAEYGAGNHQAALNYLASPTPEYAAVYHELRGDIYRDMGELSNAVDAYQAAIDSLLEEQSAYAPSLELKLFDVRDGVSALLADSAAQQ